MEVLLIILAVIFLPGIISALFSAGGQAAQRAAVTMNHGALSIRIRSDEVRDEFSKREKCLGRRLQYKTIGHKQSTLQKRPE